MAAALGLSACGGGDEVPSSDDVDSFMEELEGAQSEDEQPIDEAQAEEDAKAEAPDPSRSLPTETDVPSGYRMLPANCEPGRPNDPERTEESDDDTTEGEEPDFSTWITYTVPEAWEPTTISRGGGSALVGTDEELTFDFTDSDGSRNQVKILVNGDYRHADGSITDHSGDPWETFDYDSTSGEDSTQITYDNVGTVQAGDQEAELFYLDQAQAPIHVPRTQYKMRLEAIEIPHMNMQGEYELMGDSFVVTFEFDKESASLDQTTVETIASSFVLPECTYDNTLMKAERMLGLDLNTDGEVYDHDDFEEEMEKALEEAEAELEEELQRLEDEG